MVSQFATVFVECYPQELSVSSMSTWSWWFAHRMGCVCTSIHHLHWLHQDSSCPVVVDVPVEPSLVGPLHVLVMVGRYHHVCWLKVSLVWYVAPSCLHVGALPVVLAEVVHGPGEGENLHVGVLPHHGPAPSIQVHVAIHL